MTISPLPQPSDRELAELCAAVYDPSAQLVAGWQRVWEPVLRHLPADGGEGPTAKPDEKSGFKATVFQKDDAAVLAFAGSESEFRDWLTNLKQGIGLDTAQYRQAVSFAQECKVHFGNNLTLTGHSLGGGLATLACAATGTPAVVFNPAGVHSRTFKRIGVDPEKFRAAADAGLVRAYVVKGEVLDRVQSILPIPEAVGSRIDIPAPAGVGMIGRHKMGATMRGMDLVMSAVEIEERKLARPSPSTNPAVYRQENGREQADLRPAVDHGPEV
ncbi:MULTISPECIES: Mbeg1-like protein [Xanthomonas]|uniref:Phospholipase n=3 Tax=Xanthomonas TaxID=338 RepID=A0AB33FES8_XANCI|nr:MULTISPECIES: Mbeg1-like protein [Xanthomonas]ATS86831.1 DUF2974 domain-containing protein [Xanthomonas citri pv. phaseoli var. fuscans]WOP59006.1 Mbeg1-like protein [Xanthomonas euvesicatoria]SOO23790.1 putative Phospholipase A(1) [Xanthomonas phaseoli pv. phaseoli]